MTVSLNYKVTWIIFLITLMDVIMMVMSMIIIIIIVIIIITENNHHSMKRQWFSINIAQFNTADYYTKMWTTSETVWTYLGRGGAWGKILLSIPLNSTCTQLLIETSLPHPGLHNESLLSERNTRFRCSAHIWTAFKTWWSALVCFARWCYKTDSNKGARSAPDLNEDKKDHFLYICFM